ncbi:MULTISPECIES: hypothetical protein [unclassified Janthinobacterium]|nr:MULTISPECIES: hypothetical protein [unclassified Janthinobacterium]
MMTLQQGILTPLSGVLLAGIVLVSACGTLTVLFAARKKQGRVVP